jgi:hypothetical protein
LNLKSAGWFCDQGIAHLLPLIAGTFKCGLYDFAGKRFKKQIAVGCSNAYGSIFTFERLKGSKPSLCKKKQRIEAQQLLTDPGVIV